MGDNSNLVKMLIKQLWYNFSIKETFIDRINLKKNYIEVQSLDTPSAYSL